ncbi:MAG: hypothetical protein OER88_06495, partial [Planctomycetota bacterium]|nr:hypothetical protein [Planctomycetota bacterium]
MRWLFCLFFAVLAACSTPNAASLERPDVRVALGNELLQTLDQQEHYFDSHTAKTAFSKRLDGIAERTGNADSYYRALSDALAALGEGHTGLVGSASVPFSETIPPVAVLEIDDQFVVAGVAPGVEGGGLRPGDVILGVDGRPSAKAIVDRVGVTPGSTPHGQRARAVATLLAGPTDAPVRVTVRGIDGAERVCFPLRFLLEDSGIDRFRFGFLAARVTALRVSPSCLYLALPD